MKLLRLARVWMRLPREQRLSLGLTLPRILGDLARAQATADSFWEPDPAYGYAEWIARWDTLGEADRAAIRAHIASLPRRPRFRLVLAEGDAADAARTRASVARQLYPEHGGDGPADWVMHLRPGDVLAEHALYWFACEALARPQATLIYSDDDLLDERGERSHPRFKPDWSPEYRRSCDYIGNAAVERPGEGEVAHVPAVLLHRGAGNEQPPRRLRHPLPRPAPRVSILIPTRDAPELLRRCVQSVLQLTRYAAFEVLVVDNRSRSREALALLSELAARAQVRVLRYGRRFNYAALNNFAAREARGEALCLLNNDTEVLRADWLEELVGHLAQPGAGAVGAKLVYPDGRVQHAGMAVGVGGVARHLHAPPEIGAAAREVSAVTGACLLTWKRLYQQLGGLEERLAVSFNDVDYCLRLQRAGHRVIYTPHAELLHHESATRGRDDLPLRRLRMMREMRYMRAVWGERMRHDPYYNPNLSDRRPDFSLAERPRVRRPWTS